MVIFVTTCSGASASAMLGDVRGLKGRPQWLVFAVDVRGGRVSLGADWEGRSRGHLHPGLGVRGCFWLAVGRGALFGLYSFVDNKCIQKDRFGLLIIKKKKILLIVCKFQIANFIASLGTKPHYEKGNELLLHT